MSNALATKPRTAEQSLSERIGPSIADMPNGLVEHAMGLVTDMLATT